MSRSREKDLRLTAISYSLYGLALLCMFLGACNNSSRKKIADGKQFGKISYDMFITNRDSSDSWEEERLSGFKKEAFIDKVFEEVYKGKVEPVDFFTGEIIPVSKLKSMETNEEFSRKNISKIQFEEQWLWDNEENKMAKKIISVTISYEVYDQTGKSRGHKPIFKIIFQKQPADKLFH